MKMLNGKSRIVVLYYHSKKLTDSDISDIPNKQIDEQRKKKARKRQREGMTRTFGIL